MQFTILTTSRAYVVILRSLKCNWNRKLGLLNTIVFYINGTVVLLHSTMKQKNGQKGILMYQE